MPTSGPGRSGRPWRRIRQAIVDAAVDCAWCHGPLRPDITDPNHPMYTVVDHVVALVEGGQPTDRANLAAMHRACNQAKDNQRRRRVGRGSLNVSRDW
jgi:5-methylcytosine-specific restriction endonuclease McrA